MKRIFAFAALLFFVTTIQAEDKACEKYLKVELSQSRFSLDPFDHIKDSMNTVQFLLPVSCKFYDEVRVGDQLLKNRFRAGSLLISGSIGNWNLIVKQKYERSPK